MTSACGSVARRSSRLERARFGASTIVTRSRSKKTLHAAEQDRPDVAAARAALKAEQPSLKAPRLVFIDETAVTTKMIRHYGRSPRGERLVASVPHGHWKTLTFIAALRFDGMTAPYVIDGAMDGPTFIAYVEQVLTPTLKKGDIVFMDNLRTHKAMVCARRLRQSAQACAIYRPTLPTSTRLSRRSRNSKQQRARARPAPSRRSGS